MASSTTSDNVSKFWSQFASLALVDKHFEFLEGLDPAILDQQVSHPVSGADLSSPPDNYNSKIDLWHIDSSRTAGEQFQNTFTYSGDGGTRTRSTEIHTNTLDVANNLLKALDERSSSNHILLLCFSSHVSDIRLITELGGQYDIDPELYSLVNRDFSDYKIPGGPPSIMACFPSNRRKFVIETRICTFAAQPCRHRRNPDQNLRKSYALAFGQVDLINSMKCIDLSLVLVLMSN